MDPEGDNQPLLEANPGGGLSSAPVGTSDSPRSPPAGSSGIKNESQQQDLDAKARAAPLRYAAPLGGRKGAALRSLPVLFVFSLVAVVVGVYVTLHIAPLLQLHATNHEAFSRGLAEAIVLGILLTLFMTCFALSVFVRPGTPDEEAEGAMERTNETKSSGSIRYCKWCAIPKPDRTHHCRVCRSCVLRMDHHCPWLANCVGWGNHKYFMLLLFYGTLTCLFVGVTLVETVVRVVGEPTAEFEVLFALLLAFSLDFFLFLVLFLFGLFHLYLLTKGMSTIEFCEKRLRRSGVQPPPDIWNLGFWRNFNEVFGYNPLLWFLPIDNRRGDGKHFLSSLPKFKSQAQEDLEPGALDWASASMKGTSD